jgi:hypothetical protein
MENKKVCKINSIGFYKIFFERKMKQGSQKKIYKSKKWRIKKFVK